MSLNLVLVLAMATTPAPPPPPRVENRPVQQLDLRRYTGRWHEIAHLPMVFQRKCTTNITADYALRPDGRIDVRNACRTKEGRIEAAEAVARTTNGAQGALEVRFAPAFLSWLPFAWADYWVLDIDPDYQWAVVGSPSRKYLWILSREPRMDLDLFERLKADAVARGYPVDRLELAAPVD